MVSPVNNDHPPAPLSLQAALDVTGDHWIGLAVLSIAKNMRSASISLPLPKSGQEAAQTTWVASILRRLRMGSDLAAACTDHAAALTTLLMHLLDSSYQEKELLTELHALAPALLGQIQEQVQKACGHAEMLQKDPRVLLHIRNGPSGDNVLQAFIEKEYAAGVGQARMEFQYYPDSIDEPIVCRVYEILAQAICYQLIMDPYTIANLRRYVAQDKRLAPLVPQIFFLHFAAHADLRLTKGVLEACGVVDKEMLALLAKSCAENAPRTFMEIIDLFHITDEAILAELLQICIKKDFFSFAYYLPRLPIKNQQTLLDLAVVSANTNPKLFFPTLPIFIRVMPDKQEELIHLCVQSYLKAFATDHNYYSLCVCAENLPQAFFLIVEQKGSSIDWNALLQAAATLYQSHECKGSGLNRLAESCPQQIWDTQDVSCLPYLWRLYRTLHFLQAGKSATPLQSRGIYPSLLGRVKIAQQATIADAALPALTRSAFSLLTNRAALSLSPFCIDDQALYHGGNEITLRVDKDSWKFPLSFCHFWRLFQRAQRECSPPGLSFSTQLQRKGVSCPLTWKNLCFLIEELSKELLSFDYTNASPYLLAFRHFILSRPQEEGVLPFIQICKRACAIEWQAAPGSFVLYRASDLEKDALVRADAPQSLSFGVSLFAGAVGEWTDTGTCPLTLHRLNAPDLYAIEISLAQKEQYFFYPPIRTDVDDYLTEQGEFSHARLRTIIPPKVDRVFGFTAKSVSESDKENLRYRIEREEDFDAARASYTKKIIDLFDHSLRIVHTYRSE